MFYTCYVVIIFVMVISYFFPIFIAGPHFAAVNSNNEIIVTDFHNHSVKVLRTHQLLLTFNCFY